MLASDLTVLLIPLWILLGLVVVLGILGLLGRYKGGRYLKPLFERGATTAGGRAT
jgi:hypothetical protein